MPHQSNPALHLRACATSLVVDLVNPRANTSGRGETSVAQSPNGQSGNQSSVAPSSDLGANEWLVEEMKEQYDKDPASVGPEWAKYFGNGSGATSASATVQQPAKEPARAAAPAAKPAAQAADKPADKPASKPASTPADKPAATSTSTPKSTPRPAAAADE